MSIHKKFIKLISFFFAFFLLISLKQESVQAQQSSSITVIPPKFELFANPGENVTEKIKVRNEANEPLTYTLLVEDFTTSGEEGNVVLEEDTDQTSFSLAKWVELSTKDVVLQPKEEKAIAFTINVPKNAEPGGHYASILFQTGGDKPVQGGAKVANRVGSLVLLRISGNVEENATLETFSAPSFSQKGPIDFIARIKNNGNTHIRPEGTIVITNIFGKKVDEIPLEGRNVLPGATRKMDTIWNKTNVLGIFTATMIATYGQKNLPITSAVKFTILPIWLIVVVLIAVVFIIALIITLISGRDKLAKIMKIISQS
ncbi:DUF916 domain-containing protein [Candidatus Beckwithbacteria bacterium]|nr:DUF916 domain-containing protein [Candidatus Beckwithbacteria bacterium]